LSESRSEAAPPQAVETEQPEGYSAEEAGLLEAAAALTGRKLPEKGDKPVEDAKQPERAAEGDTEAETPERVAEDKPVETFTDLAEKAGVSPEQLYKLKVAMPEGVEPMTLGELKDLAQRAGDLEGKEQSLTAAKIEQERELMRAQDELRALLAQVGPSLPPEMVEQHRAKYDAHLAGERQRLLEAIPEWASPEAYQAGRQEIVSSLEAYGFSEAELSNVYDHRLVKLLHDFTRMEKALKTANAEAKKVRTMQKAQKPSGPSKGSSQVAAKLNAAKSGSWDQKVAAAQQLIGDF